VTGICGEYGLWIMEGQKKRGRGKSRTDTVRAIDTHVGGRIRLRRQLLGISQADLGRAIGLTFQQVQKYERGTSRIGSGLLRVIADALDVPISFFYDDFEGPVRGDAQPLTGAFPPPPSSDVMSAREARLLGLWRQAPPEIADAVVALLSACAEPGQTVTDVAEPEVTEPDVEEPDDADEEAESDDDGDQGDEAAEGESEEEAERRRRRRRRGAIWDPADIERVSRKTK
jgi:transcriptional regulator with XRE-family HTH domain